MDTFDAIKSRRSIKSFQNHEMSKDEINKLMEYAILSPTSYNIQNWRFVIITKQDLKDKLCVLSYGQRQVAEASLVIVLCADLKSWEKNPERYWKNIPEEPRNFLIKGIKQAYTGNSKLEHDQAIRSCGIAAQTIMLAAQAMGYDSCPMEGFDYNKVGEFIGLPPDHIVTMMIVVGKKAKEPAPRGGQLPLSELVFEDHF
ncbi:nitroreductase [Candidatus Nitrosarchaeum limnium SFB1]|jgi:nitroreductase|uniref:Nitroreductase n=1 Tax=Candidatus Nitrosarchaeum limnium SFB1 TaxID=886738 RepID=F3KKR6_9ARCH|nr:nitroreductase [Candidatus Nitrosarchaeum limnium SFB1]